MFNTEIHCKYVQKYGHPELHKEIYQCVNGYVQPVGGLGAGWESFYITEVPGSLQVEQILNLMI